MTAKPEIPQGQFAELKFKVLKTGNYHFALTTVVIVDVTGDSFMTVATAPGAVDVTAAEAPAFTGYAVSASETRPSPWAENAEVKVAVSNSDSIITTYNAYDLT